MTTLFEQQGGQYEVQGDYRLPCVTLPNENDYEIGEGCSLLHLLFYEIKKVGFYRC